MVKLIANRIRNAEKDFLIFLIVCMFLGIGQSVDGSALSNFLKEKFHFLILQRSALELPRELPGFLVFAFIGFLSSLGDIRIAAVANATAAVGMFLLGVMPADYMLLLIVMFVYSSGQHIYLPLSNTIGMSFADEKNFGRKLGQISAANTAALVFGSAVLWTLFRFLKVDYMVAFSIGAAAFLAAAAMLLFMNPKRTVEIKNRFVFRKEYRLFYWLSVVNGARKQIFLTFGPWVLVDVFKQKVTTMTVLFFIISIAGVFFRPFFGYLIDRKGEKFVLGAEAAVLFFVCFLYAFASNVFPYGITVIVICACYITDQTFSAAGMARSTYLRKIAVKEEDVSPTLSLGTSLDHIVSMLLPALAGLVWYRGGVNGYKYVFVGGALIALVNFISTRMMRIGKTEADCNADIINTGLP